MSLKFGRCVLFLAIVLGATQPAQADDLTTPVPLVPANVGLTSPPSSFMFATFGSPGDITTPHPGDPCPNERISDHMAEQMTTASVGPFRVTALKPMVLALTAVFAEVKRANPAVYGAVTSYGALCVRSVAGTSTPSNHAWGTAIDLSIRPKPVNPRGSKVAWKGIIDLVPFFNKAELFWGGGFHTIPDPMHFEASEQLVKLWAAKGLISPPGRPVNSVAAAAAKRAILAAPKVTITHE